MRRGGSTTRIKKRRGQCSEYSGLLDVVKPLVSGEQVAAPLSGVGGRTVYTMTALYSAHIARL